MNSETVTKIDEPAKTFLAFAKNLSSKLREWEKKIRQKQTEVGGANIAVTFNANIRKQERVLENRLDTVS